MKRQKPNSRARIGIILSLVVISLVLVFQLLGLWRPFRIVVDALTQPVTRTFSSFGRWVGNGVSTLSSLGELSQENADLRRRLVELESNVVRMSEVEKENALLRAQLNFTEQQKLDLKGSRVVGYSPDNVRRNISIDIGRADGIEEGQAVVSSGAFIGKVEKVYNHSSEVFLMSDPEFRVLAMTQNGRARGILRGQLGSGLRLEQIAQNEAIEPNEYVITAGSEKIPKGLPLGVVESVDRSDNEIFQAANVKPMVDIQRLETVFVVKG